MTWRADELTSRHLDPPPKVVQHSDKPIMSLSLAIIIFMSGMLSTLLFVTLSDRINERQIALDLERGIWGR